MTSKTTVKPLSWKPVRRGSRYCSPACGSGCTVQAYEYAVTSASALARHLGPGWTPQVWENMGWYWGARSPSGRVQVYPPHPRAGSQYRAFLGLTKGPGGRWFAQGRTPRSAVRNVVAIAQKEARIIEDIVREVEGDVR